MEKTVYILNEQGQYMGEAIEEFGISYVYKTEVAPDPKFLNGDYDVIWNGTEWEYIEVNEIEVDESFIPEPTEEEIKAMEAEAEKQRQEILKQQAKDLLPHIIELLATSEDFQALLQGAKDADKPI